MNKTDHYRTNTNVLKREFNDLKTDKSVRKQIKIDKEYKESVRTDFINKRSGQYRYRVIDVLNYNDDYEIVYVKTNNSLKKKCERLNYIVSVYNNLSNVKQCYVFYMKYKEKKKFRFLETVCKYLYKSEEDYINSIEIEQ